MENNFKIKEVQDKAFDLCLAIYRIVKHFPEEEVLISQIKKLANDLTANILILEKTEKNLIQEISWQLEKINVFLRIAGTQGWLNPINFDFLMQGYGKIKDELNNLSDNRINAVSFKMRLPRGSAETEKQEKKTLSNDFAEKQNRNIIKRKTENRQLINELNQRQRKIIDFMRKKKEAKMNDLQEIFKGEVTERTLRNDLQGLTAKKLIRAEGEFKTRKYYIKN